MPLRMGSPLLVFILIISVLQCHKKQTEHNALIEFRSSFDECIEKSGSNDLQMLECTNDELAYWSNELIVRYEKNLSSKNLSSEQRSLLKQSQSSWIEYRNAACELWNTGGDFGTAGRLNAAMCRLELAKARALQLKELETVFNPD